MLKEFIQGIRFTAVTMILLGGVYNLLLWGVGQAVFPAQAEGSLIRRADGTIVGSVETMDQHFRNTMAFLGIDLPTAFRICSTNAARSMPRPSRSPDRRASASSPGNSAAASRSRTCPPQARSWCSIAGATCSKWRAISRISSHTRAAASARRAGWVRPC